MARHLSVWPGHIAQRAMCAGLSRIGGIDRGRSSERDLRAQMTADEGQLSARPGAEGLPRTRAVVGPGGAPATIANSPPQGAFEGARALVGLVERALRFTPGIAVHGLRTALG